MSHLLNSRTALRVAFALAAFGAVTPSAEAAFTVTVNGVLVATDQGVGDQDADTGVIQFIDTVGSHQIRLTALTDPGQPGGVTISELQVVASGNPGDTTGPLEITVSGTAGGSGSGGAGLRTSLTRNRAGGLGTSGTAGGFASATGVGATGPVLLSRPVDAGQAEGVFPVPGSEFELTQTVFVTDLRAGDGLTITASAEVFGTGDGVIAPPVIDPVPDRMADVANNPAPAGLVLVAAGLPVAGLFRRRLLAK
jgi:hypothetical protein